MGKHLYDNLLCKFNFIPSCHQWHCSRNYILPLNHHSDWTNKCQKYNSKGHYNISCIPREKNIYFLDLAFPLSNYLISHLPLKSKQINIFTRTISISSPPIITWNYSSQTILPASLKKLLVKVTSGFYFAKTNAKPLAFILLELSGVFDKVHHTLLLEKLSSCEFWDTIHFGSLVICVTSTQFLL